MKFALREQKKGGEEVKTLLVKKIAALALALVMALAWVQPAAAAAPPGFLQQHSDWHFDLTKEPDRPMTVEEFIALTVAYSYWSLGEEGDTPRDRDGDLPAQWAAPYIREEARKGVIDPAELDYQAQVTLAFAMKFLVNCNGLYGYNAINLRKFSGTAGLTTEEKLCLNTAVDYGYVAYQENMNVSVTLPRRDLTEKYLIRLETPKPQSSLTAKTAVFPHSMVFFEDCYGDKEETQRQLQLLRDNQDSFNIVSLDAIYLMESKLDPASGRRYVGDQITSEYEGQGEVIDFCHANGKQVLGGVITWFDTTILDRLVNNDQALDDCAREMVEIVESRNLDGLNIDIEMSGNQYRKTYSDLVTKVAEKLHARGKTLMLTVGGYMWAKDEAQTIYDYRVINQAADLITIVTYDIYSAHSYNNNPQANVGEMSNLTYSQRCARYAATYFDPEKVLFGLGGYGICFNTTDHKASNITMDQAAALREQYQAQPQSHGGETDDCYFTYQAEGKSYIVYYESDAGMKRRIDIAKNYGLGGVAGFYASGNHGAMFREMENGLMELPFRDVAKNIWYYDSVKFAYENRLFNGTSASTFGPDEAMTRAMLVTVLWRYEGQPEPKGSGTFRDVAGNEWYGKAVEWASENGIVNGMGDGTFAPQNHVTREQMAAILLRYGQKKGLNVAQRTDISSFPDHTKVSGWAWEAFSWTVAAQIIGGTAQGGKVYLDPQGNATRGQVAKILRGFIQTYGK